MGFSVLCLKQKSNTNADGPMDLRYGEKREMGRKERWGERSLGGTIGRKVLFTGDRRVSLSGTSSCFLTEMLGMDVG